MREQSGQAGSTGSQHTALHFEYGGLPSGALFTTLREQLRFDSSVRDLQAHYQHSPVDTRLRRDIH
jgi:hypothetical protein